MMSEYHSMDEINFQWTYKKGDPTIDMGYMNVELARHPYRQLLDVERVKEKGGISKKLFQVCTITLYNNKQGLLTATKVSSQGLPRLSPTVRFGLIRTFFVPQQKWGLLTTTYVFEGSNLGR